MSRRVQAWLAIDAAIRRVRPRRARVAARSLASGALLGVASDTLLEAIDHACYTGGKYAYHDTDEHNLRGWFDWEAAAIATAFPASGRVLITAAGGGREVLAAWRAGFTPIGVEPHPVLRTRADALLERQGCPVRVGPVERDRCPPGLSDLDAAIVGWGSYGFIRGAQRRIRFLGELGAAVRPGAPVLVSFFPRSATSARFTAIAAIARPLARLTGAAGAEPGDVVDPSLHHYLSLAELTEEATAAGFTVERWCTDGYGHAVLRRPTVATPSAGVPRSR